MQRVRNIRWLVIKHAEIPVAAKVGQIRRRSQYDLLRRQAHFEAPVEIRSRSGRHVSLQNEVGVAGEIVHFKQNAIDLIGDLEFKEEPLRRARRGYELIR